MLNPAPSPPSRFLGGDLEVFDADLGVAHRLLALERLRELLAPHGDVAHDPIARVRELDEEGRELPVTRRIRIRPGHHDREIRDARTGREPLLAVQDPLVTATDRTRPHAGGVRARRPLGHREADPQVAVHERDEVALLLVLAAVFGQREHRRVLRPHAVERPGPQMRERATDLDLDDRVREMAEPHAAVLDGHEGTPQPLGASFGLQLAHDVAERPRADLGLGRKHGVVDEPRDAAPQLLYVVGNLEVDHDCRECLN